MKQDAVRVEDVQLEEMPSLSDLVSPAGVRAELIEVEPRVLSLGQQARDLRVVDEESRTRATNLLGLMKQRLDELEGQRKAKSGPFDKAAKAINRVYALVVTPLKTDFDLLKTRVGAYVLRLQQEQEEALARQRDAEQKAQRAAEREARKLGVSAPVVIPKEAPPVVQTHQDTGVASTTVKKRWRATLVDGAKAYAAYPGLFEFDEQKALKLRAGGISDVPGVRFEQVPDVSVRT